MEPASKKEQRYLMMAAGLALSSECRMKHGALVVKHSKVLGSAVNVRKNDPRYVDWKHSSEHAEYRALRRANYPKGATVFVARVNRLGDLRDSAPCDQCQRLLDEHSCRVVYTIEVGP